MGWQQDTAKGNEPQGDPHCDNKTEQGEMILLVLWHKEERRAAGQQYNNARVNSPWSGNMGQQWLNSLWDGNMAQQQGMDLKVILRASIRHSTG